LPPSQSFWTNPVITDKDKPGTHNAKRKKRKRKHKPPQNAKSEVGMIGSQKVIASVENT